MKKTLIALAAVAVTGGAFAQATITGDFSFGYSSASTAPVSSKSLPGGTSGGMGMGDADVYFAATEALDGGTTIGVNLALDLANNTAAYGQAAVVGDETMFIKTASGLKLTVGSEKGADYLSGGIAAAGSNFNQTFDNSLFTSRDFKDFISVSLPVAEGIKLGVKHRETGTGIGAGAGAYQGATAQRDTTVSIDIANGPLVVNAGYRAYDANVSTSSSVSSSLNRASASYDLGVAKIGAGYSTVIYGYGNSRTDTLAGITVPVTAALTLGAQAGQRATSGNATNTNYSGAIYSGSYALSKRTSFVASYIDYDSGATTHNTGYAMKLFTTF